MHRDVRICQVDSIRMVKSNKHAQLTSLSRARVRVLSYLERDIAVAGGVVYVALIQSLMAPSSSFGGLIVLERQMFVEDFPGQVNDIADPFISTQREPRSQINDPLGPNMVDFL